MYNNFTWYQIVLLLSFIQKNIIHKFLIKIIIPYSARKISANLPLIYSVLNPDTNSDSPSAKSKGVRFNSAISE